MSRSCAIALVGLSFAERALIESALFPSSGSAIPGAWLEPDPARAQLIIASADDAAAVAALKARALPARVLLLGGSDRGTGWPFVLRPLRMRTVLETSRRLLDLPPAAMPAAVEEETAASERGWIRRLVGAPAGFADTLPVRHLDPADAQDLAASRPTRPARPTPGSAASRVPTAERETDDEDDFQATHQFSHSAPSVAPSDWEAEASDWAPVQDAGATGGGPAAPAPPGATRGPSPGGLAATEQGTLAAPAATAERVLIVGAPGSAADGLVRTLRQAGFPVDFAAGAEAAFRLMAQRAFRFAILIEVSLGPRAISLCRAMQGKRGRSPADMRVVIVASHRGLTSRLRAQLAGCNVWLEIPLDRAALIAYLRANGTVGTVPT